MLSFLVAIDKNNVMGLNNDLPWKLPRDLKFFKELTTDNTIIMGRKTFDSIGKALPNRRNIVLTRSDIKFPDGIEVMHELDELYELNKNNPEEELFVIGGAKIFEQTLAHADRMYITYIDDSFEGDTFFPAYNDSEWNVTTKEKGPKNDNNPYDYYFLQLDRK